ncbi:MAG: sigma 54-interacting transcriptional regulator, partial [Thermodesulfobacteriota bacterium]|nr:sigma 54-interacting transcriptional regulator [Thermodesulfobacteriota bacterium]
LWGERIVHATGEANPWNYPANALPLAIIAFVVDGAVRLERSNHRKRLLTISGAIVFFLVAGGVHSILVDYGILPGPYLVSFFYLAIVLVMSYELGKDIIRSSELSKEVEANERRWRSLLENVKLLAVGIDREGRIDYVNPHFSEVTGFRQEEIIGKSITALVPESEREELLAQYRQVLSGEIPTSRERPLINKDGSKREIAWSNVLLHDPGGRATGTLSLGADITERRRAEQELQRETEQMDMIFSSMKTGLALIDPDFKVAWVNRTLRDLLPLGDPVGRKCFSFAENREVPCDDCQAGQAFADGRIHERDLFNAAGNRWFNVVAIPIKNEHGKVIKVLESNTDITDRKKAEEDLTRALEEIRVLKDRLEGENIYLKEELGEKHEFREIVGESNAMLYVFSRVREVARTDSVVLVQGETGVGKELIARAIHASSTRADHPFIKVNCAALPSTLIESELFGHERGAFTGAERKRIGRFELALKGTLLLDEIGELPLDLQSKLLHVLEDGTFQRVGGTQILKTD